MLGERIWSKTFTMIGVLIAAANMVLAWIVLFQAAESEPQSGAAPSFVSEQAQAAQNGSLSDIDTFLTSIIPPLSKIFLAGEQRDFNELVLIIGVAFTFAALGFSLFVMGVESALTLKTESGNFGSLILKTTSPGIVCFLLASAIILFTVYSRSALSVDSETQAKAELIKAKADAKKTEADARATLLEAKAEAKEKEADAKANLIDAKSYLIEEKAETARLGNRKHQRRSEVSTPGKLNEAK